MVGVGGGISRIIALFKEVTCKSREGKCSYGSTTITIEHGVRVETGNTATVTILLPVRSIARES